MIANAITNQIANWIANQIVNQIANRKLSFDAYPVDYIHASISRPPAQLTASHCEAHRISKQEVEFAIT